MRQILFDVLKATQKGAPTDPDVWTELADELERAYKIAVIEAGRLAGDDIAKEMEKILNK